MKVLISGGGTGGHVFPAIAIADALKEISNDIEILFVGATGKLEMQKVPQAGYNIVGLPIRGLKRKLSLDHLKWIFLLIISLIKAFQTIRRFKPDISVGVGGYASGPVLRISSWMGIPIVIQEQNSYPGITNKLLAKSADKIFVAFQGLEKYFPVAKILHTGNPVRKDLLKQTDRKEASNFFQLDPGKKTICVFGGSLGARAVNDAILGSMQMISDHHEWQWIWQYGSIYENTLNAALAEVPQNVKCFAFIERMDLAYAAADLVISRAGALTLSELMVTGKPSILIPSPNVAEDHQSKNAAYLTEHHAAFMLSEKELSQRLWPLIEEILSDDEVLIRMKTKLKEMARPKAAETIANQIVEIAKKCN
ncbi:MAG: undecaprenyldiphospho-muramoylpentapeptide beta-N-acetylglucosaminyltransferase [Saprospiraceae bacterium]|nr:undecaprenyldiphospho-muramoylpentapeptide beta-N-acetylglucosaminyltransferase [Saprospiraceae bacterium]